MAPIRLQKILSAAGISSRRASETLIVEGRVTVNGTTVTELGTKADPDRDDIRVDGRRVKTPARRRYILLNKPRGYITTRSDPQQRPTVIDLLTTGGLRDYVYPVGRLDYDSEGLLLLTSDGELAERLTHPKHGIGREYHVRVRGVPDQRALERLRKGIALDGQRTAPATVDLHKVIETATGADAILSMVIHEGRNRQVRRMCEAVGHPVSRLKRVRIGPITDDHIRPGEFRDLTEQEIAALRRETAREHVRTSAREHVRTSAREHVRTSAREHVRTSAREHARTSAREHVARVNPRPADRSKTSPAPTSRARRPTGRPRRG